MGNARVGEAETRRSVHPASLSSAGPAAGVFGDLAPLLLEQLHPVVDRDLSHFMSTFVKLLRKSFDSSGPKEIHDLGI